MRLDDVGRLLDPSPMPLELGYERLDDGVLHVAVRTDMHGVRGEHFAWWFRSRPDTRQYRWWHPIDHLFSEWRGGEPSSHVGSTHVVTERFSGLAAENLLIQFRADDEFFDAADLEAARADGRVSALVCGRVGFGWEAPTLPDGRILGGRLIHLGRDTEWGMVLRSHFFIGQDLPSQGLAPERIAEQVTEEFGAALLQHCYDEFTFLSRFLPSLHAGDTRDEMPPPAPW